MSDEHLGNEELDFPDWLAELPVLEGFEKPGEWSVPSTPEEVPDSCQPLAGTEHMDVEEVLWQIWDEYIRYGSKEARVLCAKVVQSFPAHGPAWRLLYELVDEPQHQIQCLQRALDLGGLTPESADVAKTRLWALKKRQLSRISGSPRGIAPVVGQMNSSKVWQQITEDPHSAELRYHYAIRLLEEQGLIDSSQLDTWNTLQTRRDTQVVSYVDEDGERQYRYPADWLWGTADLLERERSVIWGARNELDTAIAIGIDDPLMSAKARFLALKIWLSQQELDYVEDFWAHHNAKPHPRVPEWDTACKDITRDTKEYLKQHPHDLEALTLQKSAYEFLQNRQGIGRASQSIREARSLLAAGLHPSLSSDETPHPASRQARTGTANRNDGRDFEDVTLQLLRAMGLKADHTKRSADGGIDIVAHSQEPIIGGTYLVQCKDWSNPVGEPVVRDLYGLVIAEGATKGVLVTSGRFTAAAERFAQGKPIDLVDGDLVRDLTNRYTPSS